LSTETAVSDKDVTQLGVAGSKSELLADRQVAASFSTFFGNTWSFHEPLLIDQDLRKPDSGIGLTPLVSDEPPRRATGWRLAPAATTSTADPVRKTNDARVALLARKYVAKEKFSDEDTARLAILTERVRRLLPAVTEGELEALESALKAAKLLADSDAALRLRLAALKGHGG
jgi:hypothetical protein